MAQCRLVPPSDCISIIPLLHYWTEISLATVVDSSLAGAVISAGKSAVRD